MAPPRILIAGCGYTGIALGRRLLGEGWRVWGLRRSVVGTARLRESKITPVTADLSDPHTLRKLPAVDYVVAAQAPGRDGLARHIYVDGTRHLIAAVAAHPPTRLLSISSTNVYGHSAGEWVDEDTPPDPRSDRSRVLLEMEQTALSAPFPAIVLRLGGIYGPGRDRTTLLRDNAPALAAAGYLNHIHLDDAVGMMHYLLQRGQPGQVYLGVDDEPVERRVFYAWLAQQAGLPLPELATAPPSQTDTSKRCSNKKITALGYRLRYPTYRTGFPSVLGRHGLPD